MIGKRLLGEGPIPDRFVRRRLSTHPWRRPSSGHRLFTHHLLEGDCRRGGSATEDGKVGDLRALRVRRRGLSREIRERVWSDRPEAVVQRRPERDVSTISTPGVDTGSSEDWTTKLDLQFPKTLDEFLLCLVARRSSPCNHVLLPGSFEARSRHAGTRRRECGGESSGRRLRLRHPGTWCSPDRSSSIATRR